MVCVLGISVSHYGSACVVIDGKIVSAVLEERLSRKKFDAGFPRRSIETVLRIAGVEGKDIDEVAVGTMCETFDSNLAQDHEYRLATILLSYASQFVPLSILEAAWLRNVYRQVWHRYTRFQFFKRYTPFFLELGVPLHKIRFYDHHSCHTATAYYGSPWRDQVLLFTSDGNGDGYCGYISLGDNNTWQTTQKISSIHSLGGLYSRATRLLGMKPWQDEYKVMGLAPWGKRKKAYTRVLDAFRQMWGAQGLTYRNLCGYACNALLAHMNRVLNNPRFDHTAAAVQQVLEEILGTWIKANMAHYSRKRIALSGGIFYNIKANKYIAETANPEEMFIFPTAGDESISIGAAYLAYHSITTERKLDSTIHPIEDVYWGEPIDHYIEDAIQSLKNSKYQVSKEKHIEEKVSQLLADNQIVGICRGRMECCPRALGNRSLLANPSYLQNVERLNDTIKRRDFWMPFALTILDEDQDKYLVNPLSLASPYMILGFNTHPAHRHEIVAGIHQADKTCRPQILTEKFNASYYKIIKLFKEKTGIGAVLNTSLNLHGEPMVNLPTEAISLLEHSALRHLVIGDYLISDTEKDPQMPV